MHLTPFPSPPLSSPSPVTRPEMLLLPFPSSSIFFVLLGFFRRVTCLRFVLAFIFSTFFTLQLPQLATSPHLAPFVIFCSSFRQPSTSSPSAPITFFTLPPPSASSPSTSLLSTLFLSSPTSRFLTFRLSSPSPPSAVSTFFTLPQPSRFSLLQTSPPFTSATSAFSPTPPSPPVRTLPSPRFFTFTFFNFSPFSFFNFSSTSATFTFTSLTFRHLLPFSPSPTPFTFLHIPHLHSSPTSTFSTFTFPNFTLLCTFPHLHLLSLLPIFNLPHLHLFNASPPSPYRSANASRSALPHRSPHLHLFQRFAAPTIFTLFTFPTFHLHNFHLSPPFNLPQLHLLHLHLLLHASLSTFPTVHLLRPSQSHLPTPFTVFQALPPASLTFPTFDLFDTFPNLHASPLHLPQLSPSSPAFSSPAKHLSRYPRPAFHPLLLYLLISYPLSYFSLCYLPLSPLPPDLSSPPLWYYLLFYFPDLSSRLTPPRSPIPLSSASWSPIAPRLTPLASMVSYLLPYCPLVS
ncbi:hypothetical protein C7M84_013644 [Penaeus vannamei]|uniref:Uncharacterized protein n=1 Tax=Penaeus vannamei TaxID=6689 RepID=A0A423SVS5_PENVA|nr:hypothetical protein C7M84_013644 [Penaeus vannamei]